MLLRDETVIGTDVRTRHAVHRVEVRPDIRLCEVLRNAESGLVGIIRLPRRGVVFDEREQHIRQEDFLTDDAVRVTPIRQPNFFDSADSGAEGCGGLVGGDGGLDDGAFFGEGEGAGGEGGAGEGGG